MSLTQVNVMSGSLRRALVAGTSRATFQGHFVGHFAGPFRVPLLWVPSRRGFGPLAGRGSLRGSLLWVTCLSCVGHLPRGQTVWGCLGHDMRAKSSS